MNICFYGEQVEIPEFNRVAITKVIKHVIRKHQQQLGPINFIFCNDTYLLDINIKFLQHDYLTDVITFDYSTGSMVSGDVYISTEMVLNNSSTFEQTFEEELIRVISHGLLHLLGYGDKQEDEIVLMRAKENEMIAHYQKSNISG